MLASLELHDHHGSMFQSKDNPKGPISFVSIKWNNALLRVFIPNRKHFFNLSLFSGNPLQSYYNYLVYAIFFDDLWNNLNFVL